MLHIRSRSKISSKPGQWTFATEPFIGDKLDEHRLAAVQQRQHCQLSNRSVILIRRTGRPRDERKLQQRLEAGLCKRFAQLSTRLCV